MNALTASLRMELRAKYPGIVVSTVSPGVVATDFGKNALHGGMDSRALPGAQPAEEVAAVIADVIEHPRADVYTRPGAREMVAAYFAAEDMGAAEAQALLLLPSPPLPLTWSGRGGVESGERAAGRWGRGCDVVASRIMTQRTSAPPRVNTLPHTALFRDRASAKARRASLFRIPRR